MNLTTSTYRIHHYDENSVNGIAGILGALLQENLAKSAKTVAVAKRIRHPIGVRNVEDDADATVVFGQQDVTIASERASRAPVQVDANVEQLLRLTSLKMMAGGLLPIGFFTKPGLQVLADIAFGRLKVRGLVSHPVTVLRLLNVLSVVS